MVNKELKHVAIILDGNRRFAKRLILEPWKGHEYGAEKVDKLIEWCKELGIKEITLYCLSVENIKSRPKSELEFLFKVFRDSFRKLTRDKIKENQIKIRFIGNLALLPKDLAEKCQKLEKQTKKYENFIVNFALAYGGREEIIEAVKKIIKSKIKSEEINEDIINKSLGLEDEPDLIIRTGGEKRTSNFLPWQSVYSEWIFLEEMWPEFTKEDLINCLNEYNTRKRRFGG